MNVSWTSRRRRRGDVAFGLLLAVALGGRVAHAHVGRHAQLDALDAQIARRPADARLYLRRGEVYRAYRHWSEAAADYRRARKLDPELTAVDLCVGRMMLEAGMPRRALAALDRFLAAKDCHIQARLFRARALAKLGRHVEAATDYTLAIRACKGSRRPAPYFYLERARSLAAAGDRHLDAAVRGLEEARASLGSLVTIELLALELELRGKRYTSAVERLGRMLESAPRREGWLVRRGEVYEKMGRIEAACRDFTEALREVETLPAHRRRSRMIRDLEVRIHDAIERLKL